ncbi:MAG: hypothetical protein WDM76_01340 [Limisphaerales bacterium]
MAGKNQVGLIQACHMKETIESCFFVIAVIVFVIVLPLMWLRRRRVTQNKKFAIEQSIAEEHYKHHLRQPDYAGFTARYGCQPTPATQTTL